MNENQSLHDFVLYFILGLVIICYAVPLGGDHYHFLKTDTQAMTKEFEWIPRSGDTWNNTKLSSIAFHLNAGSATVSL